MKIQRETHVRRLYYNRGKDQSNVVTNQEIPRTFGNYQKLGAKNGPYSSSELSGNF